MPRSAGIYSLPANAHAVSGNTISSTDFNAVLDDLANEMTASLPRDGTASMSGVLKGTAGTAVSPSYTFGTDPNTGFFSYGSDQIGVAIGGVIAGYYDVTGLTVINPGNITTRVDLKNLTREWSLSSYGTDKAPNGAFAITDETATSVRMSIDTSGNAKFPVTLRGVAIYVGDTDPYFSLALSAGIPNIVFNSGGTFLGYDRGATSYNFSIGASVKGGVNSTGLFGDGSQITSIATANISGFATTTASSIAGFTAGGVGTMAFAYYGAALAFGATLAGSSLHLSNNTGYSTGTALTGTWKCLGELPSAGSTLFLRIA